MELGGGSEQRRFSPVVTSRRGGERGRPAGRGSDERAAPRCSASGGGRTRGKGSWHWAVAAARRGQWRLATSESDD
jgi:hypothetical protein